MELTSAENPNQFSNSIHRLGFSSAFLVLLAGLAPPLQAQDDDHQAQHDLHTLLNQQTELVTKTKVNADYVPGALTVLHANELQRYGVRTVSDALSMTPSLEIQQNHIGHTTLVTRGFGTPFSGGTVLLMLDHVNRVSEVTGYAESILAMPIEQVERIEIIRGAASVLYGGFAYAGVVNIVTRQASGMAVSAGRFGYRQAAVSNVFAASDSSSLFLSYSQSQQDKTGQSIIGDPLVYAEPSVIATINDQLTKELHLQQGDIAKYSMAPGVINNRKRHQSFLSRWQYNDSQFYFNFQDTKLGDYYGYAEILPEDVQNYNQHFEDISVGWLQTFEPSPDSHFNLHLGVQQRRFEFDSFYTSQDFDLDPIIMAGLRANSAYARFLDRRPIYLSSVEQVGFANIDWVYRSSEQSRWLTGLNLDSVKIAEAKVSGFYSTSSTDPERGNNHARLASKGDSQHRVAFYIQNEWQPLESIIITLGARAQTMRLNYSLDTKEVVNTDPFADSERWTYTPKIAAVYHFNHQHIFKAQYSRALIGLPTHQINTYRLEDKSSQAQTAHYELGYIYQGAQQVHRITLFQSKYEQVPEGTVYFNYTRPSATIAGLETLNPVQSKGVEWDAEFSLNSRLNGFANATLMRTEDVNNKVPLVGSADFMAKLGLDYAVSQNWRLATWLNHVGERHRAPYDGRQEKLAAYTLTNLNLSYTGVKKLTVSAAVQNVFAKQYAYVSAPNQSLPASSDGTLFNAPIAEDYAGTPRQFWLTLRYSF